MPFCSSVLPLIALLSLSTMPVFAEQSPTQAYLDIHRQEILATKYEDLLKVRSTRSIAKDPPFSKEEVVQMFGLLKIMMPQKVEVTGEEIKGSEAIVHAVAPPASGEDPSTKTTGTITLFMENGSWKLDSEKWESKTGSSSEATPAPVPAVQPAEPKSKAD